MKRPARSPKSRSSNYLRRRLWLESLESRALLAGDVTINLLGGTATLTGDSNGNSIVITADATTPGRVTVSSSLDDATTINGGTDPVTFDITSDLIVNLNGGNDALQFVGNDTGGAVLPRDLKLDLGDGGSNLDIDQVSVLRNFSLVFGADGGELQNILLDNASIGGNLTATTADGTGNVDFSMNGVAVTGDVRLVRRAGNASYNLGALPVSTIGGDLLVEGGDGATALVFSGGSVSGNLISRSTVANAGANVTILQSATVTGNVTVNSLAQSNHFSTFGGSFGASVSLTHGSGSSSAFVFDDQIAGNFSYASGVGSNVVILGTSSLDQVTIGGSVQIASDGLFLSAQIANAAIAGNATITSGDGSSTVIFGSETTATTVGGTARITAASGDANVIIDNTTVTLDLIVQSGTPVSQNLFRLGTVAPVSAGRDIKITGGSGKDEVDALNLTARDILVNLGDGGSDVDIDDVTARDLVVTMGTDGGEIIDDVLVGNNLLVDIAGANLARNLKVTSGDVVGSLNLKIQASEIAMDLILTHGSGNNGLLLGDTDSVGTEAEIQVGGNLKVTSGAGSTSINLVGGSIGGNLIDTAGDGGNVVSVTRTEILGNLTINSAAPSSLLFLTEQNIHGNLTANHGSGSSFVMMQAGHVGGDAVINAGVGSNNVMIGAIGLGPTTIGGKLAVSSAGLYGGLMLNNTAVTGNLIVTNGPGYSSVSLGNPGGGAVTVGGTVRITNADGDSNLTASDLTLTSATSDLIVENGAAASLHSVSLGSSGPVVVGRDLKITSGTGRDEVVAENVTARDIIFNLGDGGSDVDIDNITARDLVVTLGTDGGEIIDDVLVGNNLLVDIAGANLTRNLNVTSGDVVGSLDLKIQASEIDVDLLLAHGSGSNNLQLGDTDSVGPEAEIQVGGNLKVTTGSSSSTSLNLVGGSIGGSLTDTAGDGGNVVSVTRTEIIGSLTVNSAAPSSLLFLTEQSIHGNLIVNHGSGSSFVMMMGGHVGGSATLNAGVGSNLAMIGGIGVPQTTIGGKLTVASAGLYGGLTLNNTAVTGNLIVTNGPGSSSVSLGNPGGGEVTVGGTVRVTNANGDANVTASALTVTTDFIVENGAATSLNNVNLGSSGPVVVGRDLIVRQGNGMAQTFVTQTQVGRNLLLFSLDGNDTIVVDGSTVGGNTTIDTDGGEDSVRIGETQTTNLSQGTATVRTGAANDSLLVGSFTVLTFAPTPKFLFDGGTDTDTIDIDFALTPAISAKIKNFEFIV